MATNKHIDKICIGAVILALLISILFMNGETLGIQVKANAMGYENRLFDNSKVHTIDIVIDDWDAFLATAQIEEYSVCNVVIDGEAFTNVGIRGKGNTSLSTVASMDSDRYSFKIEFDQYDSTKTYYGLDKLSLNNLIQDNTMMKDYLTYQMMNEFGVAAPLCSYVYITVNGEDWGLYLAVEAVEESFLQRNYGSNYGELYKPDSMNMGGGRGNGKDFNFEDFDFEDLASSEEGTTNTTTPSIPTGGQQGGMMPGMGSMPEDFDPSQMGSGMPDGFNPSQMEGMFPDMGDTGKGTDDVKLQYIDDALESYANIFSSSKTNSTTADQQRLVKSLRALSEQAELEKVLDVEAVLRYFVVHNYVVNADSYTGSMIHNYYLYEQDGQLSMIPWDYNLAFGTFQGGNAASMVCDDINAPLSVTGSGRPMIDWIFASEEFTEQYHTYFAEFLDTVDAAAIISQAEALIAPYVEKDPTKFCTYEEFELGVDTLSTFCTLRSESVAAQLAGEDGTVDTSAITLSDMGTMSRSMGGGNQIPTMPEGTDDSTQAPAVPDSPGQKPQMPDDMQMPGQAGTVTGTSETEETTGDIQQIPGGNNQGGMQRPGGMELPEGMENMQPGQSGNEQSNVPNRGQNAAMPTQDATPWILLGVTALILIAGLIFAFKFKR